MLHVLPTLWFRNTWAWGLPRHDAVPVVRPGATDAVLVAEHPDGTARLTSDGAPEPLFCHNETNAPKLFGAPGRSAFPKDGIGDHVLHGLPTVDPERRGTGSCGASSTTRTASTAGWRATRPARCHPSSASAVATPGGGTWTTRTSSRCRTRGSTPGTRRGTSRSTA